VLPILPTLSGRNPNGHTLEEVTDALQGKFGARRLTFRYELLDSANTVVDDALSNVVGGSVEQNWLADIKRKAKFTMRETGEVDFLSDRIKPYVRLHLDPYGVDDWVEYPQGVFLLSTPSRSVDAQERVTRTVEGFDQLQVYSDDLVTTRYSLAAATVVTTAVDTLLGAVPKVMAPSTKTLPTAKEWEPGTSKLRIVNDLLDVINYQPLSFDEDGNAVVQEYLSPSFRPETYTYDTGQRGLIVPDLGQELDLFSIANRWLLVVSDPDRNVLTSTYTNTDPASPTSTVRRGRTIVDYRTEQDAVDQATLDAKAARLAFESSQVYEAIDFWTALMPIHGGNDVIRLVYDPLAINAKYAEVSWSMQFQRGASMKHRVRRVVSV